MEVVSHPHLTQTKPPLFFFYKKFININIFF
jgi:hypothetical protein